MAGDPAAYLDGAAPLRFLVAGHTYGAHGQPAQGLFDPFEAAWRADPAELDFAVLCGDVVVNPHPRNFDQLDAELEALGLPVFCAPGNHDTVKQKEFADVFESRYGRRALGFAVGTSAFCVADSPRGGGDLTPDDMERLRRLLADEPRVLFLFVHHLVWVDEGKVARGEVAPDAINGLVGYAAEGRFDAELLPLLAAAEAEVFVFAGDLGAGSSAVLSYEDRGDGVHLVALGMGEHPDVGCYLRVAVGADEVRVETVSLGASAVEGLPAVFPLGR